MKSLGWSELANEGWGLLPARSAFFPQYEKHGSASGEYLSLMASTGVIPYAEKGDIGNKAPEDMSKCKRVSKGDFVINSMNFGIGSFGVSNYDGICSPVYLVLKPNDQLFNTSFVSYIFQMKQFQQYAQSFGNGILAHRAAVGWDELKNIALPAPPLDEQRAIADFLDRELAQIDELIEKQEKMNLLLAQRVDRLILNAVTRGIDSEELTPCDDSWLESYQESWTFGRLKNCLRSSVTDGPHTTPEFVEDGVPFLSVDGIQNGELVFDGCRYISNADDFEFRKKANPQSGDILMGKAASVGKIAQVKVDFPFAIWSPLALLKIDTLNFDTTFVEFFLKSTYVQAQINAISNANTQQNLGMNQIPKLRFIYPNKPEQTRIAEFLTRNIELMNKQANVAEQVILTLRERRQSLISAAVTGKIDTRKTA